MQLLEHKAKQIIIPCAFLDVSEPNRLLYSPPPTHEEGDRPYLTPAPVLRSTHMDLPQFCHSGAARGYLGQGNPRDGRPAVGDSWGSPIVLSG